MMQPSNIVYSEKMTILIVRQAIAVTISKSQRQTFKKYDSFCQLLCLRTDYFCRIRVGDHTNLKFCIHCLVPAPPDRYSRNIHSVITYREVL